jgi:hypothetical protein
MQLLHSMSAGQRVSLGMLLVLVLVLVVLGVVPVRVLWVVVLVVVLVVLGVVPVRVLLVCLGTVTTTVVVQGETCWSPSYTWLIWQDPNASKRLMCLVRPSSLPISHASRSKQLSERVKESDVSCAVLGVRRRTSLPQTTVPATNHQLCHKPSTLSQTTEGIGLKEAAQINSSLLVLIRVVKQLAERATCKASRGSGSGSGGGMVHVFFDRSLHPRMLLICTPVRLKLFHVRD